MGDGLGIETDVNHLLLLDRGRVRDQGGKLIVHPGQEEIDQNEHRSLSLRNLLLVEERADKHCRIHVKEEVRRWDKRIVYKQMEEGDKKSCERVKRMLERAIETGEHLLPKPM